MKKKILILCALGTLLTSRMNSQVEDSVLRVINGQLRFMFSAVSRPTPSADYLYEMVAHVSDSVFYQNQCPDTLETDMWYMLQYEMFYSAWDTTLHPRPNNVFSNGNNYYSDTIPIGIMDLNYYTLVPAAMTTNTYFNFDTLNDILYDKPFRPGYPYATNNIFAACPLVNHSNYANCVFRLDPQFLLTDIFNQSYYTTGTYLRIDFGDGNGFVNITSTGVSHYNVTYPSDGEKIITVQLYDSKTKGMIKTSTSKIMVISPNPSVPPDFVLNMEGLNVGVYQSCVAAADRKVIIYLEGIDLLDFLPSKNRGIAQIYDEMIHSENIEELRNFGYDYYVVDWKNSRIDMRFNALHVLNLIEYLKSKYTNKQQFVIIGESMGGVVARYALTFMETQAYQAGNFLPFFTEALDPSNATYLLANPSLVSLGYQNRNSVQEMHRTRLLMTLDAPHQGANVPLSVQHFYRTILGYPGTLRGATHTALAMCFNLFLDGKAARQLLIYHVNTKSGFGLYKNYSGTSSKTSFFRQLKEMGDVPRFSKLVALSSGSLKGKNQANYYTNASRVPNDRLLDLSFSIRARVFWIPVPLWGGDLKCKTNPNGNGHIFQANLGAYTIKVKLYWFGVKIKAVYGTLLFRDEYANTKPYCTSAGGYEGLPVFPFLTTPAANNYQLSNKWILNLFSYNYVNNGAGCLTFDAHAGFNGLASLNFSLSLCSDGFHFNFIPVQSALNYGTLGTIPLNKDIENENINVKLAQTPFDVIMGYYNNSTGFLNDNAGHLFYRDEYIYNLTQTSFPSYYSCSNASIFDVKRSVLNLEVGDEELYMENFRLNRKADFQAEYDVYVNRRNPYYQYPSQLSTLLMLKGIYSKDNPMFIQPPNGFANFYADQTNTPTGYGFIMGTPPLPAAFYQFNDQSLLICCVHFSQFRTIWGNDEAASSGMIEDYMKAFPNPLPGTDNLSLLFAAGGTQATITLTDVLGKVVGQYTVNNTEAGKPVNYMINLAELSLHDGVYFVNVNTGSKRMTTKIVLSK
jgi:hypothetical protein